PGSYQPVRLTPASNMGNAVSAEEGLLRLRLVLDNSPPQSDHRRVGSIVGSQFGQNILDTALNRFFRDREPRCNLFVGIPGGDQFENINLGWCERLVPGVLGELIGSFGGKGRPARMDSADRVQQLFVQQTLEQ